MKDEKQLLLEIKSLFGWPVDLYRYGFTETVEYWDGKVNFTTLPKSLQRKYDISLEKIAYAKRELFILSKIPWIKAILITGSVASFNAKAEDDIDIWFVVDSRRIWLTRALDFLFYSFSRKRRLASDGVDSHKIDGKFCFNLYTVSDYKFKSKTPSYAIQFMDAIPIYLESSQIYETLLEKNEWIKRIFPTWYKSVLSKKQNLQPAIKRFNPFLYFFDLAEYVAGVLMLIKSEKKLILKPTDVYRRIFTTWQTKRILSVYD